MPFELDVYQTPKGEVPASSKAQGKVYTPPQVGIATFLGGPIAGSLLLASNYATLGRRSARTQALVWGVVGTAAALAVALVLPKNIPHSSLPVTYTAALYHFAKTSQVGDYQTRLATAGRQSHWKAVGIGVASLITLFALFTLYFMLVGNDS